MTKKYYAVSGYYGFGYFDNWNEVLRCRKYVGKRNMLRDLLRQLKLL